jgi:hypothetical protein
MESNITSQENQSGIGSEDAAQDLYGLGIRVGFYLQALSMILYLYGDKTNYGKGLKVASGSITMSILASWFIYAAHARFSPSEAIVVLLILMSLSFPAKITLLNPRTIVGETIGLATLLLTEIGTCAALLWTFGALIENLPRLGTANVLYSTISLSGWFRWLALAYCILDALTSVRLAYKVGRVIIVAWNCYISGRTEADRDETTKIVEIVEWNDERAVLKAMLWLTWVFVIVTVETTLHWNHLSPSNDLQSPGQLIPFMTGVILLIDSGFVAGRQLAPRYVQWWFGIIVPAAEMLLRPAELTGRLRAMVVAWLRLQPKRTLPRSGREGHELTP